MARDYRQAYCNKLGVELVRSEGSIHHIDGNHHNNNINNLVAIPQELHDTLNITFDLFPKLLKNLIKIRNYYYPRRKNLTSLTKCLNTYNELFFWIDVKNIIQHRGILSAQALFGDKIYGVYERPTPKE